MSAARTTSAAPLPADQEAFARLVEPLRRELQVHCYRMLGSIEDAEDLVQETLLRAWNRRETYVGRATVRAWLYRIATNACLDFLAHHHRRPQARAADPDTSFTRTPPPEVRWLQPVPDALLESVATNDPPPESVIITRETIELAFLVAIQHLAPRQRAVFILRDVLGWSAQETADLLDASVPAIKSALQRARPIVKQHLPARRAEWAQATSSAAEQELLRRYMAAQEQGDAEAMVALMSEDVRLTMPPGPIWFQGRTAIMACTGVAFDPASPTYYGEWRSRPTQANRQPAAAHYLRAAGDDIYRAAVLDVLRIEDGLITDITVFEGHLFPRFGLPISLPPNA